MYSEDYIFQDISEILVSEEQWKIQGTGLDVSVKKSVNMYHVPGQIMG